MSNGGGSEERGMTMPAATWRHPHRTIISLAFKAVTHQNSQCHCVLSYEVVRAAQGSRESRREERRREFGGETSLAPRWIGDRHSPGREAEHLPFRDDTPASISSAARLVVNLQTSRCPTKSGPDMSTHLFMALCLRHRDCNNRHRS